MIQKNKRVTIHYTLLADGEEVDTSRGRSPLQYVHGSGELNPEIEAHLEGLWPGDRKEILLPAERGFGQPCPLVICKVPRVRFRDAEPLKPGAIVTGREDGRIVHGRIVEMSEVEVTLDLNHPLAGRALHYIIEVVDVE